MAQKLRLTRLELKRQRDALTRYERYLPTLKLKQQQLQVVIGKVLQERRGLRSQIEQADARFQPHRALLADRAGVNVESLARPSEVVTSSRNVAGLRVPHFERVVFQPAAYSLFATPPWVDPVLVELRELSTLRARLEVLQRQYDLLRRELTRIIQRVNLFEKVNIPRARDAIRRIRIHLGDEMTAAVARAKIAKKKLMETDPVGQRQPAPPLPHPPGPQEQGS